VTSKAVLQDASSAQGSLLSKNHMASRNQYAFVHHRGERVLIDDGSISIFLLMPITRTYILSE
jgi:hypothetical protein